MSELHDLLKWNNDQLSALRDSGATSFAELLIIKPELFPQEVQDTYFGTVEKFAKAMTRPNSHKTVNKFRRENPVLDRYLTIQSEKKEAIIGRIRKNPDLHAFLQAVNKKEVTISQFQDLLQVFLTTSIGTDILLLMTDYSLSFCKLLGEIYPGFSTKNTDKVTLIGFSMPDAQENGHVEIDAEWLIDQVLHSIVYQYALAMNYGDIPTTSNPHASKLN